MAKNKIVHATGDSQIIDILKRMKKPFYVTFTNTTTKVETSEKTYMLSDSDLSFKTLGFIKSVRDFQRLNKNIYPELRANDISYFKWGNVEPGIYKDVVEVDVNNAYWNEALKQGIINEKIYQNGISSHDKTARLVSLGSLATIKNKYFFDGEKMTFVEQVIDSDTRKMFFSVAKAIDDIMIKVFEKTGMNNCLFYWVDAIFIRSFALREVLAEFEAAGLTVKQKRIVNLRVEKIGKYEKIVWATELKEENENGCSFRLKSFFVPPPRKYEQEYFKQMIFEILGKIKNGNNQKEAEK
jgi:hypothetical protein